MSNKRIGMLLSLVLAGSACASAQVTQQWAARYNGPGNGLDQATAIAVDGDGNIYVTGNSWGGFTTSDDYATVKYSNTGTQLWVARYNGPGNGIDRATAIAVDGDGNVYVTGYSDGGPTGPDYATVAYSTNGAQLWVSRYNGPANSADQATAIALDGVGGVYVTGYSEGGASLRDYATVAYNVTSGSQLWVARYNGPANGTDLASGIAVDGVGNVYVTGSSYGGAFPGTGYDYLTVAYNSDTGAQLWEARYDGAGNDDFASAIAVDSTGNIFVTGTSIAGGTGYDYATVAYAANGTTLWAARYDGPGHGEDKANALAVDAGGNVYVTGYSYGGPAVGTNFATVAYDGAGAQLWAARYNGPCCDAEAAAIALDGLGNIYVTGASSNGGQSYSYATVAYNPFGTQLWVARYSGPDNFRDLATGIAVDVNANVFVTGYSSGSTTGYDYATLKYSQP